MNADLGTRLVSAGLVTREELGQALASVPAHGGALLAELVRQGVEEDALAGFFVADGFGPLVTLAELAEAAADARVPARLAVDMLAVPLADGQAGLRVAMADPSDLHAVRELAHAVGSPVIPEVAPVSALLALLARRYPHETRAAEAVRREPASTPPAAGRGTLPPESLTTPDLGEGRDTLPDHIPPAVSDDAVVPLTRMTSPPKGRHQRPKMDTVDRVAGENRPVTADFEVLGPAPGAGAKEPLRRRRSTLDMDRRAIEDAVRGDGAASAPDRSAGADRADRSDVAGPRGPRRRRITADFGGGGRVHGSLEEALLSGAEAAREAGRESGGGWGDLSEVSAAAGIARRAARAQAMLPRRLPGTAPGDHSLSAAHEDPAQQDLAPILTTIRAAKTRDDVCREACNGLAPLGRCAVLLVLVKGVLEGREVSGGSLPKDAVRNLWIPSTSRSLLQRVVETGEPYLGPHGESSADAVFRAALSSRGGDVLLMPVVLSGRTVAVLALDEPITDGVVLLERAELLTRAMAGAFKRLVMAAKR